MKKHNLREKSRLLVEHVLNKEFLSANSVLEQLIAEAEEDRENEVSEEFGFDSEEGGEETPNDGGDDTQLDGSSEEGISDKDADKVVDDTIEIACQINAKIIAKLFDKISALKQVLDNADLDQDSREFIKFDTSITYYSDKLQDLQGKTNPGVDQSKVEEALNKISTSLEQLNGEISGGASDEDTAEVASPEEIDSANKEDDTDESSDAAEEQTEESSNESSDENKEESEEKPAEENKDESSEESEDENFDDLFA